MSAPPSRKKSHSDSGLSFGAEPRSGTILGVDWGARYIGFATADVQSQIITPRKIFQRSKSARALQTHPTDISAINDLIKLFEVSWIVLGDPRQDDGSPSQSSLHMATIANSLHRQLGIPVELCNEWGTSSTLYDSNRHDQSAAEILKTYFARIT